MADAAFATAAFPGYSIEELRTRAAAIEERIAQEASADDAATLEKMKAEIARREAVAAGDLSAMTAAERLRYFRAKPQA